MKIILSRKGFDSTAGGFASPVFPDGTLFSIPIPSKSDKFTYSNLNFKCENDSISKILNDLTSKKIHSGKWRECDYGGSKFHCHYDPMPYSSEDFTGIAFGQYGRTESHLRKQGIKKGDIFLFYGWFRKVKKVDNRWQYTSDALDIHLIWSYMEVGEILKIDTVEEKQKVLNIYPFLENHAHMYISENVQNSIYLSKKHRYFKYDEIRCLTDLKDYKGRAKWRLPNYFNHSEAFTFLKDLQKDNNDVIISHRGYGQEFVLDLESNSITQKDKEDILKYISQIIK